MIGAFDANAVAYLLEPLAAERLHVMVERAWRIHSFVAERGVVAKM